MEAWGNVPWNLVIWSFSPTRNHWIDTGHIDNYCLDLDYQIKNLSALVQRLNDLQNEEAIILILSLEGPKVSYVRTIHLFILSNLPSLCSFSEVQQFPLAPPNVSTPLHPYHPAGSTNKRFVRIDLLWPNPIRDSNIRPDSGTIRLYLGSEQSKMLNLYVTWDVGAWKITAKTSSIHGMPLVGRRGHENRLKSPTFQQIWHNGYISEPHWESKDQWKMNPFCSLKVVQKLDKDHVAAFCTNLDILHNWFNMESQVVVSSRLHLYSSKSPFASQVSVNLLTPEVRS